MFVDFNLLIFDVMELLSDILIIEIEKLQKGNKYLLKLMFGVKNY